MSPSENASRERPWLAFRDLDASLRLRQPHERAERLVLAALVAGALPLRARNDTAPAAGA